MAKQGEVWSSVHLARDPFGLGVVTFRGAVAVRERECGIPGVRLCAELAILPVSAANDPLSVAYGGSSDLRV
ncbi:hypothetical protein ABT404_17690 [Streptomyces hyaluromycini]|uniref:Uncharacterized protein n=1 Tax=Streptomyces hyaluromycini TaxID=1377993 RepID=A0ABV1WWW2_9ACTN